MTDDASTRTVTVTARVPESMRRSERAILRARVEVSSVADRAPEVVARAEIPLAKHAVDGELRVDLEVPAGLVDESASYTVFCHLDATGSGQVSSGDALTTQIVPVLTHGSPDDVTVELREI